MLQPQRKDRGFVHIAFLETVWMRSPYGLGGEYVASAWFRVTQRGLLCTLKGTSRLLTKRFLEVLASRTCKNPFQTGRRPFAREMPPRPLAQLRSIRDAEKRSAERRDQRNRLIREAIAEGHSERKVAEAIGLSPGRIHQIAKGS